MLSIRSSASVHPNIKDGPLDILIIGGFLLT